MTNCWAYKQQIAEGLRQYKEPQKKSWWRSLLTGPTMILAIISALFLISTSKKAIFSDARRSHLFLRRALCSFQVLLTPPLNLLTILKFFRWGRQVLWGRWRTTTQRRWETAAQISAEVSRPYFWPWGKIFPPSFGRDLKGVRWLLAGVGWGLPRLLQGLQDDRVQSDSETGQQSLKGNEHHSHQRLFCKSFTAEVHHYISFTLI